MWQILNRCGEGGATHSHDSGHLYTACCLIKIISYWYDINKKSVHLTTKLFWGPWNFRSKTWSFWRLRQKVLKSLFLNQYLVTDYCYNIHSFFLNASSFYKFLTWKLLCSHSNILIKSQARFLKDINANLKTWYCSSPTGLHLKLPFISCKTTCKCVTGRVTILLFIR